LNRGAKFEHFGQSGCLQGFVDFRPRPGDPDASAPALEVATEGDQDPHGQAGYEGQFRKVEYHQRGTSGDQPYQGELEPVEVTETRTSFETHDDSVGKVDETHRESSRRARRPRRV